MSVHNGGRYLKEAVESVLGQTYRDFEFLIVDDGSTDGSGEYLDSLSDRDPRVRILRQENRGLVASLNRLVEESRGGLLARMDADDVCLPDRFQAQVERLEREPALGVLGGQIELISEDGKIQGGWHYPLTARESEEMLTSGCPVAHPAVMMRRELVVALGGYRDFFTHCEDYDLWLRLSERAQISNLGQVVLQYRTHDQSVSSLHKPQQLVGTYLAQAAWLMRRAGQADPVGKWSELSEQTLMSVDLPSEEKCLLLARWCLAVIYALDHRQTELVDAQLRKLPTISPAVRRPGRLIKIQIYNELTLRARQRGDFFRTVRFGFVLAALLIAERSEQLFKKVKRYVRSVF